MTGIAMRMIQAPSVNFVQAMTTRHDRADDPAEPLIDEARAPALLLEARVTLAMPASART